MNLYLYNIRIDTLANAGSLNIGTTLNMVKNRERIRRVGPGLPTGLKDEQALLPPVEVPPVEVPHEHPPHIKPPEVHA